MPSIEDPFALLGLPRRFATDTDRLEERFVSLSSEHHPDRFTDPLEQADAAKRSAAIGTAYDTLRDPEKRADLLLRLRGGATKEDDKALPPALLMEVMEVREALEQAMHEGDDAELSRLRGWAESQREDRLGRIAEVLDAGDTSQPLDPQAASRVRLELNALRYAQRMLDQIPS